MHITKLSATALKGRSFTHDFTERVLITGANYAGKTARIEAVRLALLGYIPELGKTNGATFGLCAGTLMQTTAVFDNGSHVNRTFELRNGTVKESIATDLSDEDLASPLLDAAHYFSLTEGERIRYIFARGLAGDGAIDLEDIVAEFYALDGDMKAKNAVAEKVRVAFENALNSADALNALNAPKGTLATELAHWKRRAKDTQGTTRILTELKLREEECSAERLSDITKERDAINAKLQAANAEHGKLSNACMQAKLTANRRRELDAKLAALEKETPVDTAPMLTELETLRTQYAELPPAHDLETLGEAYVNAGKEAGRAQEAVDATHNEVERLSKEIEDLGELKECPHCHSKSKGWKKVLETGLLAQQREATKLLDDNQSIEKTAQAACTKALDALGKARDENFKRVEIEKRGADLKAKLTQAKANAAHHTETLAAIKEEIANLPAQTEAPDLAEVAALVMDLREQLNGANGRLAVAQALAQDLKRAAEAAQEHDQAEAYVEVYQSAMAILKEKQRTQVDALFETVLKDANFFTEGILLSSLVFHGGEIGRMQGGAFVSHSTFSGTETAVTYIAINAALSSKAKFRLAILDEFGRLDTNQRGRDYEVGESVTFTGGLMVVVEEVTPRGGMVRFSLMQRAAFDEIPPPTLNQVTTNGKGSGAVLDAEPADDNTRGAKPITTRNKELVMNRFDTAVKTGVLDQVIVIDTDHGTANFAQGWTHSAL